MMIFEEPVKNQGIHTKKFRLIARASSLLLGMGLITLFGLLLWHKASVVNIGKGDQRNHPTVYVPPGTPLDGEGILQGHLVVNGSPVAKSDIVIYKSDGTVASQLETDDAGYFEQTLPGGYYTLQVKVAGQTHNRIINIVKDLVDVEDIKL